MLDPDRSQHVLKGVYGVTRSRFLTLYPPIRPPKNPLLQNLSLYLLHRGCPVPAAVCFQHPGERRATGQGLAQQSVRHSRASWAQTPGLTLPLYRHSEGVYLTVIRYVFNRL